MVLDDNYVRDSLSSKRAKVSKVDDQDKIGFKEFDFYQLGENLPTFSGYDV